MGKFDELKKQKDVIVSDVKDDSRKLDILAKESCRLASVSENANVIIADIDKQFSQATKLKKVDVKFLFFAVALQCVRQYFLTNFKERLNDQDAAKKAKGDKKEHSNRSHRLYCPSMEGIIVNPVPFDAIYGSSKYDLFKGFNNTGFGHRAATLGHDPILGWVFGTANILTSTMTTWDFQSYHIKTGVTARGDARDKIEMHADTTKVFSYTSNRMLREGLEGKTACATALIKEAIHLKSDVNSKASLPIPIVSTISPHFAETLAEYGMDIANVLTVGKQAAYAALINTLIGMIHRLTYDATDPDSIKMLEVKTRKILMYSNLIASSSNIIAVAAGTAAGVLSENSDMVKKSLSYMDIGGYLVTIKRLISDTKFIYEVKKEFLKNQWYDAVIGDSSFYSDLGIDL